MPGQDSEGASGRKRRTDGAGAPVHELNFRSINSIVGLGSWGTCILSPLFSLMMLKHDNTTSVLSVMSNISI